MNKNDNGTNRDGIIGIGVVLSKDDANFQAMKDAIKQEYGDEFTVHSKTVCDHEECNKIWLAIENESLRAAHIIQAAAKAGHRQVQITVQFGASGYPSFSLSRIQKDPDINVVGDLVIEAEKLDFSEAVALTEKFQEAMTIPDPADRVIRVDALDSSRHFTQDYPDVKAFVNTVAERSGIEFNKEVKRPIDFKVVTDVSKAQH